MRNMKTLFHLSFILLAFVMLPQAAFAYKDMASTDGPALQKIDTKVGGGE